MQLCEALKEAQKEGEEESERCSVTSLDISCNNIGEQGGEAVAEKLRCNHTLEELYIGDCDMGTRSMVLIATAINEANHSLKVLDVENPRLFSKQDETTLHFARMLTQNSCLTDLHLGKHMMRDLGLETLISYGPRKNVTLRRLDKRLRYGVTTLSSILGKHGTRFYKRRAFA